MPVLLRRRAHQRGCHGLRHTFGCRLMHSSILPVESGHVVDEQQLQAIASLHIHEFLSQVGEGAADHAACGARAARGDLQLAEEGLQGPQRCKELEAAVALHLHATGARV